MGDDTWRRRKRIGPEERRLWERVAATTVPLHASRPQAGLPMPTEKPAPPVASQGAPTERNADPTPATPRPRRPAAPGKTARVRLVAPDAAPVGRPQPGLDRRTAERLRKGARIPDARIDLHGMTAERAHRACLAFLGEALGRGARVVLVITGKGRRGRGEGWREERGVLRDSLPGWLRASPLGHSIVGIYQAHRRHGGEGAFYVYLKRRR